MVKLVVCYGAPEDSAAFDRHYAETHVSLVEKIPGLRRFEAGKVLGTPDGSPAPYYYMAELSFDSGEDLQAGWEVPRDRRPGRTWRRSPAVAPRS